MNYTISYVINLFLIIENFKKYLKINLKVKDKDKRKIFLF